MNTIHRAFRRRLLFLLLALAIGWACGEAPRDSTGAEETPRADRPAAQETARPVEAADPSYPSDGEEDAPLVVFLGDSLSAGLGLAVDAAYPHLVRERLREEGYEIRIVNAGVSGDTTAGGLARVDWLLRQEPDVLVLGLGANDGLRGTELASTEENLRRIIEKAQDAGTEVLLLGMMIPPNYGQEYSERFAAIYPRLEEELGVERVPFLLEGVAGDRSLNMADNIHPNARGHQVMAETVLEHLRPMLDAAEGRVGADGAAEDEE